MGQLIVLKQKPVIEFSEMEARGIEVQEQIKSLNLESIEPTETNRASMKKMRSCLNNELQIFESQRKMIHGSITKPYKEFTSSYDQHIKTHYNEAILLLKDKVAVVESQMMTNKKQLLQSYFDTYKGDIDFISLDDCGLNVILSASDKSLKKQIDEFLHHVNNDVNAISAGQHSVRVMSLYKKSLNISESLATAIKDIADEEKIKSKTEDDAKQKEVERKISEQKAIEFKEKQAAQQREKAEAEKIRVEAQREQAEAEENELETKRLKKDEDDAKQVLVDAEANEKRLISEKQQREKVEAEAEKLHTMSFKVTAKMSQLKEIKAFIDGLGVEYE